MNSHSLATPPTPPCSPCERPHPSKGECLPPAKGHTHSRGSEIRSEYGRGKKSSRPPPVVTTGSAPVRVHKISPPNKRLSLAIPTVPKKNLWWIDHKVSKERTKYEGMFNKRLGIQDAYGMKLAKLQKQREKELIGKSFKAWSGPKMQSGIESALLSLHDKINNAEVCDMAESVLLLTYNLARATKVMDYIVAAISFMKSRSPGPLLSQAFRKAIVPFVNSILSDTELVEMQSGIEKGMSTAKDVMKVWPRIKSSPLWRKINSVVVFSTAMTLFGTEVTRAKALRVEDQFYHSKHMMRADFVYNILDLLLFVAERGLQVVKTQTLDPMFHSGSEYEKWYDEAADIIAKSKFLSNPAAHGIDIHNFTSLLDGLIAKGQSMYKYACELDRGAKGVIRGTVSQLLVVRATYLNKKIGQRTRKAPLALVLEGHSSVGKTTFANILHYYYGTLRGKNTSYGARYTRMPTAEFWDSFSSDQWSLLIDDAASFKPSALNDIDPSIKELLQIVNNAPLSANMASLEEKGACPFLGELVVATTNTPHMNLNDYFNVPGAVARRFPYHIRIRPRAEFKKNDTMLDEKRVQSVEPGMYPDWWDIEILEPVCVPISLDKSQEFAMTFKLVSTRVGMTMREFLKWYHSVIESHNMVQDKVSLSEESLRMTALCSTCKLPSGMCDCVSTALNGNLMHGVVNTPIVPVMQSGCEVDDEALYNSRVAWEFLCAVFNTWFFGGLTIINFICWASFVWIGRFYGPMLMEWISSTNYERTLIAVHLFVDSFAASLERKWNANIEYVSDTAWHYSVESKKLVSRCGYRVATYYYTLPRMCQLIIIVLSVAMVALGAYLVFGSTDDEQKQMQGSMLSSIGDKPASAGEEANVWKREVYTPSTYDLGRHTLSWKHMDVEETIRHLSRNCCFVRFKVGSDWKVAKCVALGGQYYMTTNHTVPVEEQIHCQLVRSVDVKGVTNTVKFLLSANDIKRDHDKDICVFRCRSAAPAKKIVDLFPSKRLTNYRGDGFYLGRNTDGTILNVPVRGIYAGKHFNSTLNSTLDVYWGEAAKPTVYGDCGALLISMTPSGPVILGMHQLGGRTTTIGTIRVSREDIDELLGDAILVGDSEPMLDAPSTNIGIPGPVHHKSPINYLEEGTLDVHGSFSGWRAEPKFNVQPSVLAPFLAQHGYTISHGPPLVKGWKPKYDVLKELTSMHPAVNTDIVDLAVDGFFNDLKSIHPKWKKEIMVYDIHTAINGVPMLKYVDGIKRSTSAGFPYSKPKQQYLVQLEPTEDYPDHVMINDELIARVELILERYSRGDRSSTIFKMAFKNEALPLVKTKDGKVRGFMISSVELTIVMRMYTLSFVRVTQSNHFLFESAPGIEAQSCEWDFLYQYLTQFGIKRCVFGDYKGFDKSMHPVFVLAAFELIARFHTFMGATVAHANVIRCIGYDITFAHVDFFGDLITLFGKNPSGQAMTSHVNGIVNSLYVRFVWIHCSPTRNAYDFKQNVALITYGDDNGMGVSANAPFFDHTRMVEVLATIGVVYTMADKSSVSRPYIPITEGSFLKRSWRWFEETGTFVAPLELASMEKMLMVVVPSGVVSPEVQAIDIVRSANSEYFWHGRRVFEEKRQLLLEAVSACGISHLLYSPLETWEDLLERYKQASRAFLKHTDVPPFVDTSNYRFEELQSGVECDCVNPRCHKDHPNRVMRLCLHCAKVRFDDYDQDCEHCGKNDVCELCGYCDDSVARNTFVLTAFGNEGGQYCICCRQNLVHNYGCKRCGLTGCEIYLAEDDDDSKFRICSRCGRCEFYVSEDSSRCTHCYMRGEADSDLNLLSEDVVEVQRMLANMGYSEMSGELLSNQTTRSVLNSISEATLGEEITACGVDAGDLVPRPTIGAPSECKQGKTDGVGVGSIPGN